MARRLRVVNPSPLQDALSQELHHSEKARYLNRLHCLLLVACGHSCYEVAEIFGGSPRAVERWIHRYEKDGIDGLMERSRSSGRGSRKLTQPQLMDLEEDLEKQPCKLGYEQRDWTGKLVLTHVERKHHVRLSVRQCQRLLAQLRH